MKKGDKVVCMCGSDGKLTIYKTYEVSNTYNQDGIKKVLIEDDSGLLTYIPEYVFRAQDEFRERQIYKILK
jgi:hypothetical protein